MAAQGVAYGYVSMGTEGRIETEGVVMELEQVVQFRQFENVCAPGTETKQKSSKKYTIIYLAPQIHTSMLHGIIWGYMGFYMKTILHDTG